jgi:AraC family transcriptional regulator, arabinose operon regulatory protein
MESHESAVSVYYQESSNYQTLASHTHPRHELILVIGGRVEFVINGGRHIAQAGSLVIIGYLEKHEVRVLEFPYRRYVLSLDSEFCLLNIHELMLLSILIHRPEKFAHVLPLDEALTGQLTSHFDRLVAECSAGLAFWMTRAASQVTDILIELFRRNPRWFPISQESDRTRTILEVQKNIARDYREEISLDSLAARHYISRCHLSRIFRSVTGYHFKDYLILYRLAKARELLVHTGQAVADIGAGVGYGNVNHFIRIFRQHEGVTPLQYRKKMPKGA